MNGCFWKDEKKNTQKYLYFIYLLFRLRIRLIVIIYETDKTGRPKKSNRVIQFIDSGVTSETFAKLYSPNIRQMTLSWRGFERQFWSKTKFHVCFSLLIQMLRIFLISTNHVFFVCKIWMEHFILFHSYARIRPYTILNETNFYVHKLHLWIGP